MHKIMYRLWYTQQYDMTFKLLDWRALKIVTQNKRKVDFFRII